MAITTAGLPVASSRPRPSATLTWVRRNKTIVGGVLILLTLIAIAFLAP